MLQVSLFQENIVFVVFIKSTLEVFGQFWPPFASLCFCQSCYGNTPARRFDACAVLPCQCLRYCFWPSAFIVADVASTFQLSTASSHCSFAKDIGDLHRSPSLWTLWHFSSCQLSHHPQSAHPFSRHPAWRNNFDVGTCTSDRQKQCCRIWMLSIFTEPPGSCKHFHMVAESHLACISHW